jgi:hypothetical protein
MRLLIILMIALPAFSLNAQNNRMSIVPVSARPFFIDCSNDLKVLIPGLTKGDRLSYEIRGGRYMPGRIISHVMIVPSDTLVELKVFRNSIFQGSWKFKAVKLKTPEITKSDVTLHRRSNVLTMLSVHPNLNELDKSLGPEELNYKIEFELAHARLGKIIERYFVTTDSVSISNLNIQKGDRLILHVVKILRINSIGEVEVCVMENPRRLITIALN